MNFPQRQWGHIKTIRFSHECDWRESRLGTFSSIEDMVKVVNLRRMSKIARCIGTTMPRHKPLSYPHHIPSTEQRPSNSENHAILWSEAKQKRLKKAVILNYKLSPFE